MDNCPNNRLQPERPIGKESNGDDTAVPSKTEELVDPITGLIQWHRIPKYTEEEKENFRLEKLRIQTPVIIDGVKFTRPQDDVEVADFRRFGIEFYMRRHAGDSNWIFRELTDEDLPWVIMEDKEEEFVGDFESDFSDDEI